MLTIHAKIEAARPEKFHKNFVRLVFLKGPFTTPNNRAPAEPSYLRKPIKPIKFGCHVMAVCLSMRKIAWCMQEQLYHSFVKSKYSTCVNLNKTKVGKNY